MSDYIVRALSSDGGVRAFAAVTTDMVNQAHKIHQTNPIASAALGRTLTAAAMMSTMFKGEKDTLTIQIKGDGPLRGVVAVADANASVKGYVYQPQVELPLKPNGKLDVSGAIGKGSITVIRDLGLKEPYVGHVPLATGEIAEDLTLYYARSEQIPSAVALGVLVDVDLSIKASGGFIIQLMPEADDKAADKIEQVISQISPVTTMISEGMRPEDILDTLLKDFEWNITDRIETRYQCDCSRHRIERALISLGKKELEDIISEQGQAELTCHFCNEIYHFDKEQLVELLSKSQGAQNVE
ncbi:Hsp33 family molecular chaperone HslO [Petroclostridium sp. X23]|uniref:Hsp33 family molecular chaperone HslO n=1 Tax=Petroclostridium sp. X23 TaxID=3045146 RepID=UPI0024AE5F31|nr:Hsp33 family molecular chaperone HslO [Petroclostridium sp. X23]WHH61382.1 Hsp33 family molecular chaperone HslO [Petroclostridium sp. X23]